jgi:NodT family efflux transporter outer membrane factor (OMF) lipoprotein
MSRISALRDAIKLDVRPGIGRFRNGPLVAAALLLAGCSADNFSPPDMQMPERWSEVSTSSMAPSEAGIAARERWWTAFGDPALDALIDAALLTNNDLAVAAVRVREAKLRAGLIDTNLVPGITTGGSNSWSRDLRAGVATHSTGVNVGLSYEVDLWGKLSRQRDIAHWEADATEADRQAAALLLIGTTASLYWQLGQLNQSIATSDASIAYVKKLMDFVQTRHADGSASALDVTQAGQSLANQQNSRSKLLQQRTTTRHALALLFDRPPEERAAEPARLPKQPLPSVRAGIPAAALARRPDVRAVELRLREDFASIHVTRSTFYPTISLTGSLGSSSSELADILSHSVASLTTALDVPVQWNTARLTIAVSEAQYDEAATAFRQTLYKALGEVEDALSALAQLRAQAKYLEQSVDAARRAEGLLEVQYRAGAVPLKSWLDQQDLLRTSMLALDQNRLDRLNGTMKLYQALGGGAS